MVYTFPGRAILPTVGAWSPKWAMAQWRERLRIPRPPKSGDEWRKRAETRFFGCSRVAKWRVRKTIRKRSRAKWRVRKKNPKVSKGRTVRLQSDFRISKVPTERDRGRSRMPRHLWYSNGQGLQRIRYEIPARLSVKLKFVCHSVQFR